MGPGAPRPAPGSWLPVVRSAYGQAGARLRGGTPAGYEERLERVMGIEPTLEAWEAPVLPLNYTRKSGSYVSPGLG